MPDKTNKKKQSKIIRKRPSKGMRKYIRRKKSEERRKVGTGQS